MKLSLAQIRQIQEYLEQGISIRKIATLCQVGRNTVRRYQRNSHRSRILSEEHCFLNNNIDIIRKIFFECKMNCVVLKRILKGKYNEIIQLRMLQSFCRPFREEERVNFHSKCKILGGVAEFFGKAFLCRFPPEDLPRPVVYPVHSLPV